jgi:tetratricopeptide (TPR) repeat protein
MMFRITAVAILATWIPTASAQPQTAAEQLQKGVYTQQTLGDLDAAAQIYRQIITTNPGQNATAAQAQFRLFQTLLQKGDLNGAQQEFQTLVLNYPDYRDLIATMSGRPLGGTHQPNVTLGTVQNGRYHHKATGIEFAAPAGWALTGDSPSSDNGEMVVFCKPNTQLCLQVWLRPDTTSPSDITAALHRDLDRKHEDRPQGWTVRPASVQMRMVGGQQAIGGIADFRYDVQGGAGIECLTWVRSTKGRAFFFATGLLTDASVLQSGMDQLLASTLVP